jgi:hypothetical protein
MRIIITFALLTCATAAMAQTSDEAYKNYSDCVNTQARAMSTSYQEWLDKLNSRGAIVFVEFIYPCKTEWRAAIDACGAEDKPDDDCGFAINATTLIAVMTIACDERHDARACQAVSDFNKLHQ